MKNGDAERFSQILPGLAEGSGERMTVADLVFRMKDRAHAAL